MSKLAFILLFCLAGLVQAQFANLEHRVTLPHERLAEKPILILAEADSAIAKAEPDCDCMEVSITGDKDNQLRILLDSSVFSQNATKSIAVRMADGRRVTLKYHCIVPQALIIDKPSLLWEKGKRDAQSLNISIPKDSPITDLVEAGVDKEGFILKTQRDGAGKYRVIISPKADTPAGLYRLIIVTNSPYAHSQRYLIYLKLK